MKAVQREYVNLKLALPTISGGYVRFDVFTAKWLAGENGQEEVG